MKTVDPRHYEQLMGGARLHLHTWAQGVAAMSVVGDLVEGVVETAPAGNPEEGDRRRKARTTAQSAPR